MGSAGRGENYCCGRIRGIGSAFLVIEVIESLPCRKGGKRTRGWGRAGVQAGGTGSLPLKGIEDGA